MRRFVKIQGQKTLFLNKIYYFCPHYYNKTTIMKLHEIDFKNFVSKVA